mgnify:FL=1
MLSPHYSLFDSKKRQELNKNKEYTSNMRGNAGFRVRRKSRSETPSPPPSPSFLNTNATRTMQIETRKEDDLNRNEEDQKVERLVQCEIARRKELKRRRNDMLDLKCVECGATETPQWRKDESGESVCNACGVRNLRRRRKKQREKQREEDNQQQEEKKKLIKEKKRLVKMALFGEASTSTSGSSSFSDDEDSEETEYRKEQRREYYQQLLLLRQQELEREREREQQQQQRAWRGMLQFPSVINDIVEAVRYTFSSSTSNWKNEDQRVRAAEKLANSLCEMEEEFLQEEGANDDIAAKAAQHQQRQEEPEEEVEVEDQQKTITGSDNEENENNFVSNAVPPNHMLGYNHAIQEMMRSVVDQSNRPRLSSSANDGTVEEEEDLEEDANNDEGFRIQNLVSNNSPKGPSSKAAKPDIINSMEKERIVKAIRQKYWSNKDKDGLSSARQLSKEE